VITGLDEDDTDVKVGMTEALAQAVPFQCATSVAALPVAKLQSP